MRGNHSNSSALALLPGQRLCPVCGHPAWPLPPDQDPHPERGQAYRHPRVSVLCRLTAIVTREESK